MARKSHRSARRPTIEDRIEPVASVLARTLPLLVLGAVFAVLWTLSWSRPSPIVLSAWLLVGSGMLGTLLTFAMYLPLPIIRLAQVPSPDVVTWQSIERSCVSFAKFGGITNVWVTTDAVHVVSPNVHHVYPHASLERIEARPPRSALETFSPVPVSFNLVLHRRDGGEVPVFVLAPISVARSIRRAIRANTDQRPPCMYRQGEAA